MPMFLIGIVLVHTFAVTININIDIFKFWLNGAHFGKTLVRV